MTVQPASAVARWCQRAWLTVVLLTVGCGAVIATATTGPANVVVVSGLVFAVTVGTCWPWCLELGRSARVALELGLGVVGLVLATWGLVTAAGAGAILIPILVLAGAPAALPRWRRLVRPGPVSPTFAGPPDPADGWERWRADELADAVAEMRALPLPMLCQFWRESGHQLASAGERQAVWLVERRALCLDEIERRRPDELRRWLEGDQRRDLRDYLTSAGEPPSREAD